MRLHFTIPFQLLSNKSFNVLLYITFGMLPMLISFFASIVDAIRGNAAFFAPEIVTSPEISLFPMIFKYIIKVIFNQKFYLLCKI